MKQPSVLNCIANLSVVKSFFNLVTRRYLLKQVNRDFYTMYYSQVVVLLGLFVLAVRSEKEVKTKEVLHRDDLLGSEESLSDADLAYDETIWRNWRPWKFWKLDSQRTVTRRDSSLIISRRHTPGSLGDDRFENDSSTVRPLSIPFTSDSAASLAPRPIGSTQRELVTMLFESMLGSIVSTWEVIPQKPEESNIFTDFEKTASELTLTARKKKSGGINRGPMSQRSKLKRIKSELPEQKQVDPMRQTWWASPDERAIIRFYNGNVYEGSISMKCMEGEGRFQWADGTVYLGQFKDNQMNGKGLIQWKDDTWYQGDFVRNVRHGRGLYVDSRRQRSYAGEWNCATNHGQGVIYFSKAFKNSFNGEWEYNVRHGFGCREYSQESGYKGEWDNYLREGKGLMIWPNHDFYRGDWKNGLISGYGIYIWGACYNNTMSLPSISVYRGHWIRGQRNGNGILNLGLGLGSYYKGEFKNNKKHGVGKFVTNNGLIIEDKNLFIDDNIGPLATEGQVNSSFEFNRLHTAEGPYNFNICDSTVGLLYHVQDAMENIEKQSKTKRNIINKYLRTNKSIDTDLYKITRKDDRPEQKCANRNLEELIDFEESSLRKSLKYYEADLKNIYNKYATKFNIEEIYYTPVLIRLYLWQFYYDCNVHEKGLTLVDIDKMFHRNPQWLSRLPHYPFEKIYFWQFIHSIITVASRLYAKREFPGPKPDTILASAFKTFMEKDILPNVGQRKGRLGDGYGQFIPLKGVYDLYYSLNEPCRVRDFLCAIRRPPHYLDHPQPPLIDASEECLPLGYNAYIFGDEMTFVSGEVLRPECYLDTKNDFEDLKMFNFGNLSSKAIIKIFQNIFPQLCEKNKIMDLDIEITFFEFFEAFIACSEESIRIKDEEIRWREKFSENTVQVTTKIK